MLPKSTDARRFVRIEHRVPVWVVSPAPREKGIDAQVATAVCCNLSLGGMCLQSRSQLSSSHLRIKFATPTGSYVTIPCRVIRSLQVSTGIWEYGLQFDRPLPSHAIDFEAVKNLDQQREAMFTAMQPNASTAK